MTHITDFAILMGQIKEGIRQMDKFQSIMEELTLARMLIRELGDRLAKLESKT